MKKITINYYSCEMQLFDYNLYEFNNKYDNLFWVKSTDEPSDFLRFKFTRGLNSVRNNNKGVNITFEDNYDLINFLKENDIKEPEFTITEFLIKSISEDKE